MPYTVVFTKEVAKEIQKLDPSTRKLLERWLNKHLVGCEDLRAYGKSLTANWTGYWRYRIGSYRLICQIKDDELIVLALAFGHRNSIYENG